MRDFYDVYELSDNTEFSLKLVADAFEATCKKRGTFFTVDKIEQELYNITNSLELKKLWSAYSKKNYFVESIEYEELIIAIGDLIRKVYK